MSNGIGSAFLGDKVPHLPFAIARPTSSASIKTIETPPASPSPIPALLSLQLRVRWLEALIVGPTPLIAGKGNPKKDYNEKIDASGLAQRTDDVQRQLDEAIEANDGFRRFMDSYEEYESLLTPSFALLPTGTALNPPSYDNLSSAEVDALLLEMEPELRSTDRDLREIEALDKRGVTGAGKLSEHESMNTRLATLVAAHAEDAATYKYLELRITKLLQRYSSHVNALSDLFIAWNDTVAEIETKTNRLERQQSEEKKLAFD